jgi:hypothetical protein
MKWHIHDIGFLVSHLPHAVHDLIHHEDTALVKNTLVNLKPRVESGGIGLQSVAGDPSVISIEKTLDPVAQRAAQNIGLLLHDYISQLPSFDVSDPEARRLVEHWRKIMLEQPERLSNVHLSHGHSEKTKNYWRDKLLSHSKALGISPEVMMDAWDDWQRTSAIGHDVGSLRQKQAMQEKQWQDLVMRARLHHETMKRDSGQSPTRTLHY